MPSESYHTDNSQTPSGNISPSQTGTEISQHTSISPPSPSVPTGQTPLQIQDGLPLPSRYWAILSIALGLTVSVLDGAIANDYDEAFAFMERRRLPKTSTHHRPHLSGSSTPTSWPLPFRCFRSPHWETFWDTGAFTSQGYSFSAAPHCCAHCPTRCPR